MIIKYTQLITTCTLNIVVIFNIVNWYMYTDNSWGKQPNLDTNSRMGYRI